MRVPFHVVYLFTHCSARIQVNGISCNILGIQFCSRSLYQRKRTHEKKSKLLRSLETERSSHLVQFPFVQQIIVPVKFLQFSTPHYLHGVVRQPRFVFHLSILPLSLGAYISLSKRQFPSRRGQIALLLPCGMEKGSYLCFTNHSSLITLLGVGGFRHLSSSTDVPSALLGITRGVLSVSMDHSPPLSQLVVFSY